MQIWAWQVWVGPESLHPNRLPGVAPAALWTSLLHYLVTVDHLGLHQHDLGA